MAQFNPKIFKAYDIRGTFPDQVNEKVAFWVGQAYAQLTGAKRVVVGRDMRLSSEGLFYHLVKGLTSQGVMVDDIGLVPVDMVYFARGFYKYDGGIMVTASHNPKEYNGFKMVREDGSVVKGQDLKEFTVDTSRQSAVGKVDQKEVYPEFLKHIFSFVDLSTIKPFKIVVDAGNGMAGKIIPKIAQRLPGHIIPLNFELDGNFPAHPSNPLLPESRSQITEAVVREQADFGLIFDGDADRLFLVDEKGQFIPADMTLILLAEYFLKKNPGAGIVYNAVCSKAVAEKVKEWGGQAYRCRVGYAFVRDKMIEHDCPLGGELSAHYAFKGNYFSDSGMISMLIGCQIISEENKPLSELIQGFTTYYKADEHNLPVEESAKTIEAIKREYNDGQIDELDGVTITYPDWWFNVRPSNTEPLLRVTAEADTKEIFDKNFNKLVDLVESLNK